jgi:hypothetical protein
MAGLMPRPRPCSSCPYRADAPSGVWAREEYEKLPGYDGEIIDQAQAGRTGPFLCHSHNVRLCSGWVAHRDHPSDLLAIRLGVAQGWISPDVYGHTAAVALHVSGAAACACGLRDMDNPGPQARRVMAKIARSRASPDPSGPVTRRDPAPPRHAT